MSAPGCFRRRCDLISRWLLVLFYLAVVVLILAPHSGGCYVLREVNE